MGEGGGVLQRGGGEFQRGVVKVREVDKREGKRSGRQEGEGYEHKASFDKFEFITAQHIQ